MTEFVNWATLATYGGALAMVLLLTQFTKDLVFVKNVPTQIWSFVLSFIVLLMAVSFTEGLTIDLFAQTILNAVIISVAANGSFEALQRLTHNNTQGTIFIDSGDPDKDIYRLDVGDLTELKDRTEITLKVAPNSDLEPLIEIEVEND